MNKISSNRPDRKRNRLRYFDYSQNGYFFITICVKDKKEYFGNIEKNKIILNDCGQIAQNCWLQIPKHFPHAILDEFIIMPNHVHGIIQIDNDIDDGNKYVGNKDFCSLQPNGIDLNENICSPQPWQTKLSRSLSSIIRGFKIGVTKWCRNNNKCDFQWQKSFYDHIIRDEQPLYNIRQYIRNNPVNWSGDRNKQEDLYY